MQFCFLNKVILFWEYFYWEKGIKGGLSRYIFLKLSHHIINMRNKNHNFVFVGI